MRDRRPTLPTAQAGGAGPAQADGSGLPDLTWPDAVGFFGIEGGTGKTAFSPVRPHIFAAYVAAPSFATHPFAAATSAAATSVAASTPIAAASTSEVSSNCWSEIEVTADDLSPRTTHRHCSWSA